MKMPAWITFFLLFLITQKVCAKDQACSLELLKLVKEESEAKQTAKLIYYALLKAEVLSTRPSEIDIKQIEINQTFVKIFIDSLVEASRKAKNNSLLEALRQIGKSKNLKDLDYIQFEKGVESLF